MGYARPGDYVWGAAAASVAPVGLMTLEKFAPSHVGKGGFPKMLRLATFVGLAGGFLYFYQRSSRTLPAFLWPQNPPVLGLSLITDDR